MTGLAEHYSAHDIEARLLAAIRAAGLDPDESLAPEDLGALDHLHTGGRRATLDLPVPEASFDLVWMQNVGMNIADKPRLYAEVRRVLRPCGRFAFQEIAAGEAGEPCFPLPWATDPTDSFLVPVADLRGGLEELGFVAEVFEDTSDAELRRPPAGAAPGPLTIAAVVEQFAEKSGNARRSLQEGRTRLVRGVFRAD